MNVKLWKTAGIAAGIAVLVVVFLLILIVGFSLRLEEPEKGLGIWVTLVTLIGAAVAGGLSVKLYESQMFVSSLAAGILYLVILGLVTLPFGSGFDMTKLIWQQILPLVISLVFGKLLGSRGTNRFKNSKKASKHASKIYRGKH